MYSTDTIAAMILAMRGASADQLVARLDAQFPGVTGDQITAANDAVLVQVKAEERCRIADAEQRGYALLRHIGALA